MSDTDKGQHEGLVLRINDLIRELGIGPDKMVTDIMLLAKATDMDGDVSMHIAHTMKKDWVLRGGFLAAAQEIEDVHLAQMQDEDDEE